jgi:hypothetical protein
MCTQYLHRIHPPTPFPYIHPHFPLVPTHTDRTCSALMFSKKKKMTLLFMTAIQGVSLWHFHVYMYYNPIWFISIFLLFTLVPFLWWFQHFLSCWTIWILFRKSLPINSSVLPAFSCTSFKFSYIKVLNPLWIDTCTGWKTWI